MPQPVLPFVQQHKPHDRMNALVSPTPHLACLPFAFGWPMSTSISENIWHWQPWVQPCVLAFVSQQLLGINVAATNEFTLEVQRVVDAKPKTAREIVKFARRWMLWWDWVQYRSSWAW